MLHDRHFTREEADAHIERLEDLLARLREAKDGLTDEQARGALTEAAPANGGGTPGRLVGESFLELRRLLAQVGELGVVLRDIDRGLVDFPAVIDDEEVYLCWCTGEEHVGFWHDLESGFNGRRPLD